MVTFLHILAVMNDYIKSPANEDQVKNKEFKLLNGAFVKKNAYKLVKNWSSTKPPLYKSVMGLKSVKINNELKSPEVGV